MVIQRVVSREIGRLSAELQNKEAKLSELEKKYKRVEAEKKGLAAMRPTVTGEMQRLTTEIVELSATLADQPKGYLKLKVSDDDLCTIWSKMSHHITALSRYVAVGVAKSPLGARAGCAHPFIMGQIVAYGSSDIEHCSALLQNWIWRCVIERIVDSADGPWVVPTCKSFMTYYHSLLGKKPERKILDAQLTH